MKWWIRSQRSVWVVIAALLGTVAVIISSDEFALPIPSLSGPGAFAAVRPYALVAVLITVTTWASASAGHKSAALSATRPLKLYVFISLCSALAICALGAGLEALVAGGMSAPLQLLLRDILGLFGLGLILAPFTGYRFAGIVSTVYVFVSAIFGRTGGEGKFDSALWAWPISESTAIEYWIPAIFLFAVGGALWLARPFRGAFYSRIMITQAMDDRRE